MNDLSGELIDTAYTMNRARRKRFDTPNSAKTRTSNSSVHEFVEDSPAVSPLTFHPIICSAKPIGVTRSDVARSGALQGSWRVDRSSGPAVLADEETDTITA
jgi:hypothetical protein